MKIKKTKDKENTKINKKIRTIMKRRNLRKRRKITETL